VIDKQDMLSTFMFQIPSPIFSEIPIDLLDPSINPST
jgi:hypothetical protein